MVQKPIEPVFEDDGKTPWLAVGCPFAKCKHKFKVVWQINGGLVSFRRMNLELLRMIKQHVFLEHYKKKGKGPTIIIDDPLAP